MIALRLGNRKDRRAWKLLRPRTPRPGSGEPRAIAHPCVRTPARRNAKPRLSVRPTEIHGGVWSSVAVVYHRAGTHPERRNAMRNRRLSNTNEREALGLEGRLARSLRVGRLHWGDEVNAANCAVLRDGFWEGSIGDRNA